MNYYERATRYARNVVAGKVPNCRWVVRAAERHLSDIERSKRPSFPYVFDSKKADAICAFAEELPHVKGKWAKKKELIRLEDWQCFILCSIFGWVHKKTRLRRFRKVYLKIPRKNGKSVLAAIIGLYMWSMDGEHGAEVYSGATTEKQAWEVFRPARQMLEKSEELKEYAEAEIWAKSLVTLKDESRFEPIIGQPGDGASPHCSIHDEFHEHDTPDQVDTMETGMGAREQPLLLEITTAGYNIAGPCYDQEIECRNVLLGLYEFDTLFCVMFGIDEAEGDDPGDDWADPKVLDKANPNIDISVSREFLLAQQRAAVLNPVHQNKFKTKHLNVWCSAKTAWMSLPLWGLCGDPGLRIEDFKGRSAWYILDLASKDDIAAFTLLFKKKMNGADHFFTFSKYYVPESCLTAPGPNQASYQKWHRQGLLTISGEEEIDFDEIQADVFEFKSYYQVKEVVYDSWRATHLVQGLKKKNVTCVEIPQQVRHLSTPMKELYSAVKGGRFHHDGNPITTWMMSNVVAKADAKDNIYPRKEKREMKIDGAVTIIMGMARAILDSGAGVEGWLKSPVSA